jgi:hypothetical protein
MKKSPVFEVFGVTSCKQSNGSWIWTCCFHCVLSTDLIHEWKIPRRRKNEDVVSTKWTWASYGKGWWPKDNFSKELLRTKLTMTWDWVEVLFIWLLLFIYWRGGPDLSSSLCPYFVCLYCIMIVNEWDEACLWPIAVGCPCRETPRIMRLNRRGATLGLGLEVKYTFVEAPE